MHFYNLKEIKLLIGGNRGYVHVDVRAWEEKVLDTRIWN